MQKKILKSNLLFFIAYGIIFTYILLIQKSELSYYINSKFLEKTIYGLIIILLTIKLLSSNVKIKKIIFLLILLTACLMTIAAVKSEGKLLVLQIYMIICSRNVNFEKIIKFDLIIRIFSVVILLILSKSGLINNYELMINGLYKSAYGWQHPNMFGATILTILIEIIYIFWNKKELKKFYVFFMLIIIVLFKHSASRTQLYAFSFLLIWIIIIRLFPKINKNKIVLSVYRWCAPICALMSFIIVKMYNDGNLIAKQINRLLTGRIAYSNYFIKNYGISIFGEKIKLISSRIASINNEKAYILDMSYIRIAVMYGIVFLVIFLILYTIKQRKNIINNETQKIIIMLYFAIIGITSTSLISIFTNPSLFLLCENNELKEERI